ncbi:MAG: DNA polymerase III subunit gamma/tau [Deltaproteobacteria bacterium]
MAYEALSRKWRPKTFGEVVGQGHVTRALANAISQGKVHHAYLFTGTRGIGKTTFARILARALNCEKGPTATPCLACPACGEMLAGSSTDVQEIDGASNTGIDDVRRLRENAAYAPARLRYKIYIIDEVHMLSKQAFNGLLKILEEPPSHVVFIFATTEPNRIPDTILSRVQRFDFRMLTEEEIFARLREMADAEKIAFEEDALRLVARYAFGSMRDGQSILEQAAVSGDGRITAALVEEALGLVGIEAAIDLATAVVSGGAEAAIRTFTELLSRGADLKFLFLSLVDVLRDASVWKFTGRDDLLFRHAPSSLARMKTLCDARTREEWMFLLDVAFRSEKDVLGTEFPRLGFELLLLRLVNAPALLSVEALSAAEAPGTEAPPAARPAPAARPREPEGPARPQTTFAARPPAPPPAAPRAGELWEAIRRIVERKKKPLLLGLLHQMKGRLEGDALVVTCPHQMQLDRLREDDKWPVLLQAVEEAAGRKLAVTLAVSEEKKSREAGPAPRAQERTARPALDDPLLAEILREFDGATVVEVKTPAAAPARHVPEGAEAEEAAEGEGAAAEEED